ncbi:DivIVA domain-containing protein [Saccharopolyspora shandongensis]|uniref:Cell wall synthesis protein Wag31 n=1 Tax=Saccharopolyspora shandongensis TaxID=418495 RepID=A0A1H3S0U7_9PSEU|nr:DivIVA domain-containing protein [Saccharopolyspora shandongensis]SDZ31626.1 DivIVA domain-containing protein [Saccharopolyspora shandongensis]
MLTPDDMRNVAFARSWRRNRGYDEREVDAFLERVEAALRGKRPMTARDVLTARFSPGKPGRSYKKVQVAEFLDQVALTLMKREVRESERREKKGGAAIEKKDGAPSEQKTVVRRAAPAVEPVPQRGEAVQPGRVEVFKGSAQQNVLDKAEVDAFMDRVEATLRGADTLTAQDVLGARFNPPGPGRPGYQEASVFAFLVMVSTMIKNMTPRQRPQSVPAQGMSIARAFPRALVAGAPQLTPEAIGSVVLHGSAGNEHGYDEDEVDDFLDRVVDTLRGADTLTSRDVQSVAFRAQPTPGAGYDRAEVESLLDLIAERLDADAPVSARRNERPPR